MGMSPAVLRDGDNDTCITIPSKHTKQQYLKARMAWPIHSIPNPNYNVSVIGNLELSCNSQHMMVFMKVGATWGNPSFVGNMKMCTNIGQSASTVNNVCIYVCEPAPEYSEGVYVWVRNVVSSFTSICEVVYNQ